MTNKEFETRRNERTEELAQTLMNNNYKIVSKDITAKSGKEKEND